MRQVIGSPSKSNHFKITDVLEIFCSQKNDYKHYTHILAVHSISC